MPPPYVCKICGKEMQSLREVVERWKDVYCQDCDASLHPIKSIPIHKKLVKRMKVAVIIIPIAIGIVLKDFFIWALSLVQAFISFGLSIGALMKAGQKLFTDILMFPIRMVLAGLILFGIGRQWVSKCLPEVIRFVNNDLPYV